MSASEAYWKRRLDRATALSNVDAMIILGLRAEVAGLKARLDRRERDDETMGIWLPAQVSGRDGLRCGP